MTKTELQIMEGLRKRIAQLGKYIVNLETQTHSPVGLRWAEVAESRLEIIQERDQRIAELEALQEEQAAVLPEDCSLADWAKAWRERTADLEADRDRLRAALEDIHMDRRPAMREWWRIHTWAQRRAALAIGLITQSDWEHFLRECDAALSATGDHEHPDTVSRAAINELLDEHEEACWNMDDRKWVRDTRLETVQDIRTAIAALPEEADRG